ncbi:RabGAP/TBC [Polychaeton citri CBS 116435]|uniref:GTPase-activating protein GYP5 n=1 Tax=Polychaeton citri CBS 116435 TaxID=1314669 RepID=A0A9P4Q2Z3_9PEZI|nr:RabGAP/TBC [Polychaeton citri CBS 116435]
MPEAPATKPTSPDPAPSERANSPEQRPASTSRTQSTSPPPTSSSGTFAKKATSGFGAFLARATSIRKTGKSPTPRPEGRFVRRDTGTSVASVDSNAGVVASIAEETEDPKRPSLQDQFRSLRRRQEEGLRDIEEDGDNEKTPVAKRQSDAGVSDPSSPTRTRSDSQNWPRRSESTPNALKSPPLNATLPPGTASGMSAGPATEPEPVNWDLWQKVVYEGPAAVARSSGEELNHAIATGIPPAIRGVVWQVLAESKDENLEGLYRTLKTRGSGDEQSQRPSVSRADTMNSISGNVNEKDSTTSSRSSVHSESSTPATSNLASPPASVDGNITEVQVKLLAEKQKREAAALTKLERAIKRDLGTRTSYSKFTQSAGLQDGLFGVCKAFALFDENVGYAQGINFIAMPLLFNLTEEEAFSLLVRLMHKYDLRSMFTTDMPGLHRRLYQFERLLEDFEPALYCHLRRRNVQPQLYATQWFLTLFAYRFPLQLVLRIYDLVFSQGVTAVLKFGIVLMQRNRDALLAMRDMGQLTTFLKEKIFDVYIDKAPSASSLLDSGFFGSVTGGADKELYRADEMVRDACNIPISDEILNQYSAEWEESQRLEREREAEMENLRSANISLTTQVRGLEERVQQHDAEHVNIAGDLVRTKVENDRLQDENEGLHMKMEELQRMVDVQPAEVEGRLREEMERIMQRNLEVQNENRHLREEMDEMEHELVNAKVGNAQLQAEYETVKQKWNNIQTLLNDRS